MQQKTVKQFGEKQVINKFKYTNYKEINIYSFLKSILLSLVLYILLKKLACFSFQWNVFIALLSFFISLWQFSLVSCIALCFLIFPFIYASTNFNFAHKLKFQSAVWIFYATTLFIFFVQLGPRRINKENEIIFLIIWLAFFTPLIEKYQTAIFIGRDITPFYFTPLVPIILGIFYGGQIALIQGLLCSLMVQLIILFFNDTNVNNLTYVKYPGFTLLAINSSPITLNKLSWIADNFLSAPIIPTIKTSAQYFFGSISPLMQMFIWGLACWLPFQIIKQRFKNYSYIIALTYSIIFIGYVFLNLLLGEKVSMEYILKLFQSLLIPTILGMVLLSFIMPKKINTIQQPIIKYKL